MRLKKAVPLIVVVLSACSSSSSGGKSSVGSEIAACSVPTAADTGGDSGAAGCSAQTMLQICQVPSGSTVGQNNTVVTPDGGVVSCSDACSPTEYFLTCHGNATAAGSLNCNILPIPTPNGVNEYCCPCGG